MATITLRHEFDCDADTFWRETFFNDEWNRRLYFDILKFPGFKVIEQKEEGDKRTRKVLIDPPVTNIPGPMKKVIGDKLSYVEEGTFDAKANRYTFKITPSTMGDKSKTSGEFYVETLGPKKIARIAKVDVEVKVFMIGSLVEEKILGDLKASYESAAQFTREFLKEKGL